MRLKKIMPKTRHMHSLKTTRLLRANVKPQHKTIRALQHPVLYLMLNLLIHPKHSHLIQTVIKDIRIRKQLDRNVLIQNRHLKAVVLNHQNH